jgi:hypothetical protein
MDDDNAVQFVFPGEGEALSKEDAIKTITSINSCLNSMLNQTDMDKRRTARAQLERGFKQLPHHIQPVNAQEVKSMHWYSIIDRFFIAVQHVMGMLDITTEWQEHGKELPNWANGDAESEVEWDMDPSLIVEEVAAEELDETPGEGAAPADGAARKKRATAAAKAAPKASKKRARGGGAS